MARKEIILLVALLAIAAAQLEQIPSPNLHGYHGHHHHHHHHKPLLAPINPESPADPPVAETSPVQEEDSQNVDDEQISNETIETISDEEQISEEVAIPAEEEQTNEEGEEIFDGQHVDDNVEEDESEDSRKISPKFRQEEVDSEAIVEEELTKKVFWVNCDYNPTSRFSCYDCRSRLICKFPGGGKVVNCDYARTPYCNNGICSATPSASCA